MEDWSVLIASFSMCLESEGYSQKSRNGEEFSPKWEKMESTKSCCQIFINDKVKNEVKSLILSNGYEILGCKATCSMPGGKLCFLC